MRLQSVTMTGDTAFGGPGNWLTSGNPGRWDIRNPGTTLTMNGGKPFNLYKVGSNQMSFVSVTIDTNLANIDIQQGMMGFEAGSTSMGNPASNLIVRAGATLEFYQSSAASNTYTKQFILYGDGVTPCITNWPGGGSSTIFGQMTLNGDCVIGVNGTSFTNNCTIIGGGNLIKSGPQPLTLGGSEHLHRQHNGQRRHDDFERQRFHFRQRQYHHQFRRDAGCQRAERFDIDAGERPNPFRQRHVKWKRHRWQRRNTGSGEFIFRFNVQ